MTLGMSDEDVFLVDASAWHRSHHAAVREIWRNAAPRGQVATCAVVRYELPFSARGPAEFRIC